MKIYLENDKIWKIHPDMLKENWFAKYIQIIRHFKRIFSEESILVVENDCIQKVVVTDKPVEYGKILHYDDHDYYLSRNNDGDEDGDEDGIKKELSVIIDKSIIYYDTVYQIPPRHVSENITQYTISLQKKSRIKMILEIVNNRSHDMYFLVPDNMNIQDTCSSILSLVQLVKI